MPVYSVSRLGVYETCPRQYRFQYLDRLEVPEVETVERFLGNRVHDTLETLYKNIRFGRVPSLEGLVELFREAWRENWHDQVLIRAPDLTAEEYRRAGERQLEGYYRRYAPFDRDHTLAVERRILFPLDRDGGVWFQGVLDRLSRARDGLWQIRDYKTGQYLPSQAALDEDRQLGLYELGVRHLWPMAGEIELVWHFLAHDLELRSRRAPASLEALRRETLARIRGIERDETFPTRVAAHCETCSYQPVCPAWRHREEIAASPAAAEAVGWVDRLAELKAQKQAAVAELDAEIEALERRIADYADAQGLEAVFGTAHYARISRGERFHYPLKDEPGREELEDLLRRHGRWGEVAALDVRALPARVHGGEWPAELVDAVLPFESREETVTVRVAKRPDAGGSP
ncbi:MAG: PD-(D/E)XK nuclease family protein [Candidatus Rokubacteria bacterium]|nr:PD-(D/E)XK nuclease family protein [Candidatus Rokubacteria bacterium]